MIIPVINGSSSRGLINAEAGIVHTWMLLTQLVEYSTEVYVNTRALPGEVLNHNKKTDRFTALALVESVKLSADLMLHEPEQTHRRRKKPISNIVSC